MIKQKEANILAYLRRNARENITKIAKDLNMPLTTAYDRVRSHENKIIRRYSALLDFKKMGMDGLIKFLISCSHNDMCNVEKYLSEHPNINSLYKVNHGCDFLAEGVFKSVKDSHVFIESLYTMFGVREIQLFHVLDEIKKEEFLTDKKHLEVLR